MRCTFCGREAVSSLRACQGSVCQDTPLHFCPAHERQARRAFAGHASFSESQETPMNRQEMLAAIASMGGNPALFRDAPDELLAEVLRLCDYRPGQDAPAPADAEEKQIVAHHEKFSEEFGRLRTTKGQLLAGFRAMRRLHPDARARDFLGVNRGR